MVVDKASTDTAGMTTRMAMADMPTAVALMAPARLTIRDTVPPDCEARWYCEEGVDRRHMAVVTAAPDHPSNEKRHKKIFKMLLATSIAAVVWVVCLS